MTTPGYPDWERLVRAGGDFVTVSRVAVPATVTLGPFNVQQWAAIMMWSLTPAGSDFYQINWNWYDDANQSNLLSSIFQVIGPDMEFPLAVPVGGPWLVISLVPKAGGNNAIPVFTFSGLPQHRRAFDFNTYSGPILQDRSNTPANTVLTFTGTNVHYGKAKLHVNPPSGDINSILFKFYKWASGAYTFLYEWDSLAAGATLDVEIAMPASPWQLSFGNGATAQMVLVSLTPSE